MKDFVEIERKFIIEKPRRDMLLSLPSATASAIEQIYLKAPLGVTRRVRKRSFDSCTRFYETVKRRIDEISSYEDEREISEAEYVEKSKEIKKGTAPVLKERISFLYEGKTFEIDIYPKWKKTAVMEVELSSRDEEIKMPDFIRVLREVTGKREYSNAAMAKCFPTEI